MSDDREQQEKYPAEKWCCTVCAQKRRCSICDVETTTACSDCAIDLRATVYVCSKAACRKAHDAKCPHELAERVIALERALQMIIDMNRMHARDQYGDADKAESWSCVTVARAALNGDSQ